MISACGVCPEPAGDQLVGVFDLLVEVQQVGG
jgi:hypothetical protein